jgi:selenocysteine-specific elongation factor
MRRLILGTAGHIDHGKTALVRALTGIDTDRLPEEKRRGITIDLGFALLALDAQTEFGIVDVPGHEGFIRNMLAGATGIDLAVLVVAADEGVMPQTREHAAILDLLGIRSIVVALTRIDIVDPDWLPLVVDDVRRLLADGPYHAAEIVPLSARTGQGLDDFRAALARAARDLPQRDSDDLFRLPIDRAFTVQGTGTVVTGTIWSGSVRRDDVLEHFPSGSRLRVRGVQSHNTERASAAAGERAALAVTGTGRVELARGDWLLSGAGWTAARMLTVQLRALPGHELRARQRVRVHVGTAEALARLVPLGAPRIAPGQTAWAQLRLETPLVARAGDRFVIRSYSPVTTIGGGLVAEPAAPKRKRLSEMDRSRLADILGDDPMRALAAAIDTADWQGIEADRLPIVTPGPPVKTHAALVSLSESHAVVSAGKRVFSGCIARQARKLMLECVRRFQQDAPLRPGIDREEARRSLPAFAPAELAEHSLHSLLAEQLLLADGRVLRTPDFQPHLNLDQAAAVERIFGSISAGGLTPPLIPELPADLQQRPDFDDLLHYLERQGRLTALGPGMLIDTSALDRAVEQARLALRTGGPMQPAGFKNLFGISRKFLIPLLEYFDRAGLTVRTGEARELAKPHA